MRVSSKGLVRDGLRARKCLQTSGNCLRDKMAHCPSAHGIAEEAPASVLWLKVLNDWLEANIIGNVQTRPIPTKTARKSGQERGCYGMSEHKFTKAVCRSDWACSLPLGSTWHTRSNQ